MGRFVLAVTLIAGCGLIGDGDSAGATSTPSTTPTSSTTSGDADEGGVGCETASREGEATYYAADGTGNCSFPASPDDLAVAAMNTADYDGARACGACVEVHGPDGTVTVRIVDRCPGCAVGDIDLSESAFAEIAEPAAGRVPITWNYVPCSVHGPIRYQFKDGSNQWWSAVQVRNHRHRVAKLEYLGEDGYRAVQRLEYNYFVEPEGMGPGPYAFRITDVLGQTIEDEGIEFVEDGEVDGSGQFPACD